jgi:orotate phosphoribosyltransferase
VIMMDSNAKAIGKVRNIINDECIARVPHGSKELPSIDGKNFYVWQFYLRRAVLDPLCLEVLCDDFWRKNEAEFKRQPFQIAGVESAAVPIITALILSGVNKGYSVNAFTIRKERKLYGRRNLIEGAPNSLPVLIVDDLTSPQHNAFWHTVYAISTAGLKLNGLGYVLVLKKKADESRVIETSLGRVIVESLFTLSDFSMTLEEYQAEKANGQA